MSETSFSSKCYNKPCLPEKLACFVLAQKKNQQPSCFPFCLGNQEANSTTATLLTLTAKPLAAFPSGLDFGFYLA